MYKREKPKREDRYRQQNKSPSFSSSLLDEIYKSIDNNSSNNSDTKIPNDHRFYVDSMQMKQSRTGKRVKEAVLERNSRYHRYFVEKHHEDLFFRPASTSSDSNSSIFSSSDTELVYGKRISRPSCFCPSRPKPRKTEQKRSKTFYENRVFRFTDGYNHNSAADHYTKQDKSLIKSEKRATEAYSNLKKVKTPVSPGGRLVSFINSLFNNTKKSAQKSSSSSRASYNDGLISKSQDYDGFIRKSQDYDGFIRKSQDYGGFIEKSQYNYGFIRKSQDNASTCSSASSFSRSCLSKSSDKSFDGVKRSVRFSPVSVIVDENSRSYASKRLLDEEDKGARLMSVSVPSEWKIRKSLENMEDGKTSRRSADEFAREFLRDYHEMHKNDGVNTNDSDDFGEEEEEEDNYATSDSSSDLFEIDVIGNHRYRDELPVYKTTRGGLIV